MGELQGSAALRTGRIPGEAMSIQIEKLRVEDVKQHPIWQVSESRTGQVVVKPVKRLPVDHLDGRLVATQVVLANGDKVWALLGNVDLANARSTEQFLTLSVFNTQTQFNLARYHDAWYGREGPAQLAQFLGLAESDIFPISYDLTNLGDGDPAALIGTIPREPRDRLTRDELMGLLRD